MTDTATVAADVKAEALKVESAVSRYVRYLKAPWGAYTGWLGAHPNWAGVIVILFALFAIR